MVGSEHAEELLQIEEADAWFEYLEATRAQNETRYAELEPWAWARLSQRLRAVRARRARPLPSASAARTTLLIPCLQAMPTVFTPNRSARPAASAAVSLRAPTLGEAFVPVVPQEEEARTARAAGAGSSRARSTADTG